MNFVLIDRLVELTPERVVAEKTFVPDEAIFADHFPGSPLVPGSLLLESMAQTCGWWISWRGGLRRKSVLLLADGLKFRHFVRPGERILMEGNLQQSSEGRAKFVAQATVAGKVAAQAELIFAVFAADDPSGPFQSQPLGIWLAKKFEQLGGMAAAQESK